MWDSMAVEEGRDLDRSYPTYFTQIPLSAFSPILEHRCLAYMGTDARPESENEGWCLSTSSLSRDSDLSEDVDIVDYVSGGRSEECRAG